MQCAIGLVVALVALLAAGLLLGGLLVGCVLVTGCSW